MEKVTGKTGKKRDGKYYIIKEQKWTTGGEGKLKLAFKNSSQVEEEIDEAKWFLENSNWLKTEEAAEYLRTSPKQIRNWVYQGKVKAYKLLGKSLRFKRSELDLLFKGGLSWE
jgi:excisionase family DNA binding protein